MVGAVSRLLFLSTGPITILHRRPFALLRVARRHSLSFTLPPPSAALHRLLPLSSSNSLIPIKFSQKFHSRASSNALQENSHIHGDDYVVPPPHPWPEWSHLLESLSVAGYLNGNCNIEDEFVANENLSMEFVTSARSCLAFARDRPDILGWLPRRDIEVLIGDGSPFLFKNAIETQRRMRSFLQAGGSDESKTVDLMKYILSYASNPIIYPERNIKVTTESSVRNLLQEMANLGRGSQASEQFQAVTRDDQMPRNLGPNITMKRGDWICPKCSFMNFARNTKCLECEELRPQRQLTGGEWDCPQCNFFNYRKNVVCLKCQCRRPGQAPLSLGPTKTPLDTQPIGSRYHNDFRTNCTPYGNNFSATNKNQDGRSPIAIGSNSNYAPYVPLPADMFARMPEKTKEDSQCFEESATTVQNKQINDPDEQDKPEGWFKKVMELHGVTNPTNVNSDNDFPQIMPVRKKENQFEDSNKKRDRPFFVPFPPDYFAKKAETSSSHSIENRTGNQQMNNTDNLDLRSFLDNGDTNGESSNNQFRRTKENPSGRSGWTGKSLERSAVISRHLSENRTGNQQNTTDNLDSRSFIDNGDRNRDSSNNIGITEKSLEGSAVTELDPLDMSEEAKAERWFRRVAQIKDISELSQIPDEDFPSIMPMRKGVNRFVVSKRKTPLERRLTSPQYRKNLRIMSSDPTENEGKNDN